MPDLCHVVGVISRYDNRDWRNSVILPVQAEKFSGPRQSGVCHPERAFYLAHDNRAVTGDNASYTDGQTWRVDVTTGALKKAAGSFCHLLSCVNHAGVTARGFPLEGRVPRDSKNAELCPISTTVQKRKLAMVYVCNRLEPFQQSVQ